MSNQISKVRREEGKKKVADAISEMVDDEQAALDDLAGMEIDERDDFDEGHWMDWDDYSIPDSDPIEDDYVEDDYVEDSDYDPYLDMDDTSYYDPFWEMGYDLD